MSIFCWRRRKEMDTHLIIHHDAPLCTPRARGRGQRRGHDAYQSQLRRRSQGQRQERIHQVSSTLVSLLPRITFGVLTHSLGANKTLCHRREGERQGEVGRRGSVQCGLAAAALWAGSFEKYRGGQPVCHCTFPDTPVLAAPASSRAWTAQMVGCHRAARC